MSTGRRPPAATCSRRSGFRARKGGFRGGRERSTRSRRAILAALETEPCGLDGLVEATGASPGRLLAAVVRLELEGELEREADTLTFARASHTHV